MKWHERILSGIVSDLLSPVRVVEGDNNRIAREVVYHARVASELIHGGDTFDGPAVHRFLRDRIRYEADLDPLNQRLRMPWRTVLDGTTDCKSSAIMIGSLAKAAGRRVALTFIDQDGAGQWDHVYASVDGQAIDPLCPYGETLPCVHSYTVDL